MAEDTKITAARRDERARCASIMALAEAVKDPKTAASLAFGSAISVTEARTKLQHLAAAQTSRERSRASMRKAAGLPPEGPISYTAAQLSMLKAQARGGLPGDREAARAMLTKAGHSI